MRDRGFVLLAVLWTTVLLALLTTRIVVSARSEAAIAGNLRTAAEAEAAADGAVHEAAYRIISGQWSAMPDAYLVAVGGVAVTVAVENESCKLDLNTAPVQLFEDLLIQRGLAQARAAGLAWAAMDFRTPGPDDSPLAAKAPEYRAAGRPYGPSEQPFRRVDELALVLGVTPELLVALAPDLSVYNEGGIDERCASPPLQAALTEARAQGVPITPGQPKAITVRLRCAAAAPGGGRFVRRAVLRLRAAPDETGPAFEVLAWDPS